MLRGSFNAVSGVILAITLVASVVLQEAEGIGILPLLVGGLLALSPRQVLEWERALVLRLGRFQRLAEPEPAQHMGRVLPRVLSFSHEHPMPGIGIGIQSRQVFDLFGPQRVQVNVANDLQ